MKYFPVNSVRCLAMGIGCLVVAASLAPRPALAIAAPDARAVCLAGGGIDAGQSGKRSSLQHCRGGDYRVVIGNGVAACTLSPRSGTLEPGFRRLDRSVWHA